MSTIHILFPLFVHVAAGEVLTPTGGTKVGQGSKLRQMRRTEHATCECHLGMLTAADTLCRLRVDTILIALASTGTSDLVFIRRCRFC